MTATKICAGRRPAGEPVDHPARPSSPPDSLRLGGDQRADAAFLLALAVDAHIVHQRPSLSSMHHAWRVFRPLAPGPQHAVDRNVPDRAAAAHAANLISDTKQVIAP
jgi:hypothetical protein